MMIERLKKLEADATPGPWGYCFGQVIFNPHNRVVTTEENARLVAVSRNALPKLLAIVDKAESFAYCIDPYFFENNSAQNCGTCSGCALLGAYDALEDGS